jgi:hypothetical protein
MTDKPTSGAGPASAQPNAKLDELTKAYTIKNDGWFRLSEVEAIAIAYAARWRERAEQAEAERDALRKALQHMLAFDWEDGEIGVGHRFQQAARTALEAKP